MKLELENGFIEYRSASSQAELEIYPDLTGLQAKVQRFAFQSQQYITGAVVSEVPRLSISQEDLEPIIRFVAAHIVAVDVPEVDFGLMGIEEKSEFVMRLGYQGALELAGLIVAAGRLKPATKKKS
jgi:hypothetical protein